MCDDDREYHHIPNGPQEDGLCPHCGEITTVEFSGYEYGKYWNMDVISKCEHFEEYDQGEWFWKDDIQSKSLP